MKTRKDGVSMKTQREVIPYSSDYLMSRYYLKDLSVENMTVDTYRAILNEGLPQMLQMNRRTLSGIYEVVQMFKGLGLATMSESSVFYVDFEDKKFKAAFKVQDGIFDFLRMRYDLLRMDYKSFDRDKLITLLTFFRYINSGVSNIDDQMIEDIFNYKFLYHDLKESKAQETHFNYKSKELNEYEDGMKSLSESFKRITNSKAGIDVAIGRTFVNRYGNHFKAAKLILNGKKGNTEFIVYIPIMIDGVYSVGYNKFVKTHIYEHYALGRVVHLFSKILRVIIDGALSITKAYYINKGNEAMIRHLLQTAINNIFYAKRLIKITKSEIKVYHKQGVWIDPDTAWQQNYYVQPFTMISNKTESLTPFEIMVEHHKFYFREYTYVDKSSAKNILNNIGKFGYEKHRYLPLNNDTLRKFDPAFINSKANYLVAWLNSNKKSLIEIMDRYSQFNYQSFRNAAGPYVVGHAFKLEGIKEDSNKGMPPRYDLWFVFKDHVDDKGLSTYDGQRLLTPHSKVGSAIFEGIKLAFNGLDKGICRITEDKIYAMINGKKTYLNITSAQSFASRTNFSPLIEGLCRAKTLDAPDINKLKLDDLQVSMEVFKEKENGDISLGYRQVGLMSCYFVHDIDSSYKDEDLSKPMFKSYKLGSEWFTRARLMGADRVVKHLLGDFDKQQEKIIKLVSTSSGKLHGKRGSIVTKVYQKEIIGFTSTVSANVFINPGEARIYLKDEEFEAFITGMLKIEKNFNIDGAKQNFYNGGFVVLPPGLQLRNPSVDDANTIFTRTYLYRATSKFAKHGYAEVNPIVWARQGGDFDGDQVIFVFFPFYLRKELTHHFKYTNHEYNYSFEYKLRDAYLGKPENIFDMSGTYTMFNSDYRQTKTFDDFLNYIATFKNRDEKELRNLLFGNSTDHFKPMTKRDMLIAASRNTFTTRVSKQLIGVSKTITMKALFFIENAMTYYDTVINEKGEHELEQLKHKLRKNADAMNAELVQPTIDIQKWSDNLQEVVRILLIVYRMSEAVNMLIENEFYPTNITQRIIIEAMKSKKPYHEFLIGETNLEYFNDKDYRFSYSDAGWTFDEPVKSIETMINVIDPDGYVYKSIVSTVDDDLKDMKIDEIFNTILK